MITINYFWQLCTIAMYYLRWSYTTLDGNILLSAVVYYFRRLYIIFDSYILLLTLPDYDFVRMQDFIAISHTYGLKLRLDFNINILVLKRFCFFCSSTVSSINFNASFGKFCFIRNTQMLEMWNFVHLRYKWFARQASKPAKYIN